jgi:hypothetical protein
VNAGRSGGRSLALIRYVHSSRCRCEMLNTRGRETSFLIARAGAFSPSRNDARHGAFLEEEAHKNRWKMGLMDSVVFDFVISDVTEIRNSHQRQHQNDVTEIRCLFKHHKIH